MASHRAWMPAPAGSIAYPPARSGTHELLSVPPKILDFPVLGNCTRGHEQRHGEARRHVPAERPGKPTKTRQLWRARRRSLHVLVIRHNPNTLRRPLFFATARTTSAQEPLMGKSSPRTPDRRFSRLGEKNLTRRLGLTLRSGPSYQIAGNERPLSLTHGATDANGR